MFSLFSHKVEDHLREVSPRTPRHANIVPLWFIELWQNNKATKSEKENEVKELK